MKDDLKEIQSKIYEIRGFKVMLDSDLAKLYGVGAKVLNQAVKRNISRFPSDFMFQLTRDEKDEVVTNCDHLSNLKYRPTLPYAFTEQGVAMLAAVINSQEAIDVNIYISAQSDPKHSACPLPGTPEFPMQINCRNAQSPR